MNINTSPEFYYWHVYTDENGVSRQKQVLISNFEKESMGGKSSPQWNRHLLDTASHIMYAQLPVGWEGDWHENPKPQWIIPLTGAWYVETMDGQRVEMGPGEVSFGADQHTKEDGEGRKGHKSGNAGNTPALLMIIQLNKDEWVAAKPGIFNQ